VEMPRASFPRTPSLIGNRDRRAKKGEVEIPRPVSWTIRINRAKRNKPTGGKEGGGGGAGGLVMNRTTGDRPCNRHLKEEWPRFQPTPLGVRVGNAVKTKGTWKSKSPKNLQEPLEMETFCKGKTHLWKEIQKSVFFQAKESRKTHRLNEEKKTGKNESLETREPTIKGGWGKEGESTLTVLVSTGTERPGRGDTKM